MVVGGWGVRAACLDDTTCALVAQWGQDAVRVTSVCTGAFLLAGITAAIDLALALIEEDAGKDAAHSVARELAVAQRRAGGQSQFSSFQELEPESDRMRRSFVRWFGLPPRAFGGKAEFNTLVPIFEFLFR